MGVTFRSLTWTRFRGATPGAADARRVWPTREGLRVLVTDTEGRIGQGEACPLPGYSSDDVRAAERALAAVFVEDISPEPAAAVSAASRIRSPSARFAVETALLDLIGQQREVPLATLLGLLPPKPRPVALLVHADEPAAVREAVHRGVEAGFSTFKVKVGAPGRFASDRARLEAAKDALPPEGRLRADANRGFDDPAFPARLDALAPLGLEWLEEPAPARRIVTAGSMAVPVALDESLADERESAATARLCADGRVAAVVLKPAVLGGLFAALQTARQAGRFGVPSVVSHLFDGPIAYAAYAALACALEPLHPCDFAHGLGPHGGLEPWPEAPVGGHAGWLSPGTAPGLGIPLLPLPAGEGAGA